MNLWLNLYWPNAFIWDTFNVQIIYPLAKKYNEFHIKYNKLLQKKESHCDGSIYLKPMTKSLHGCIYKSLNWVILTRKFLF